MNPERCPITGLARRLPSEPSGPVSEVGGPGWERVAEHGLRLLVALHLLPVVLVVAAATLVFGLIARAYRMADQLVGPGHRAPGRGRLAVRCWEPREGPRSDMPLMN